MRAFMKGAENFSEAVRRLLCYAFRRYLAEYQDDDRRDRGRHNGAVLREPAGEHDRRDRREGYIDDVVADQYRREQRVVVV